MTTLASLERLPPHDIEAEEAVVAALLVDPEAIFHVAPILKPLDFFREKNGWIYESALDLWSRDEAINQITVAHELARKDRLEETGGQTYLAEIIRRLPTSLGAEFYAHIVKRDSTYRGLIHAATGILQMAYAAPAEIEEVFARSEDLLQRLRTGESFREFVHIRQLLQAYLDEDIEAIERRELAAIRTGYSDLDTLLGGLKRSDLVIIGARPSVGKSSFALGIARNAAVNQRANVAFFSLEMSGESLAIRLLSAESGVDSTRLRLGQHTEPEEQRIIRASGELSEANIWFDDSPVLSVAELRRRRAGSQASVASTSSSSTTSSSCRANRAPRRATTAFRRSATSRARSRASPASSTSRSSPSHSSLAPSRTATRVRRCSPTSANPAPSSRTPTSSCSQPRRDVHDAEQWAQQHPDLGERHPKGVAQVSVASTATAQSGASSCDSASASRNSRTGSSPGRRPA
jgi:replicative DNA helicase